MLDRVDLRTRAIAVLRENDLGDWTRPAPRLYPHQWSWDSAFIAIGLARLDPARALRELASLLRGQWADGRIPHIVYNPAVPPDAYFPDADRWECANCTSVAPTSPRTSGIIQPPVHALAVERILAVAGEQAEIWAACAALVPGLLRWHRYLAARRDLDSSGLLTVYHPWESGTDNSPRWDGPLANVVVGEVPPYIRRDLAHVADPSQRPTNAEYDRYLWLVESLKACAYDDAVAHRQHPFLVKDVLFSAIFAAANAALARVVDALGLGDAEVLELRDLAERFTRGVMAEQDASSGLALDRDLQTGEAIPVVTWAGLAPLVLPQLSPEQASAVVARLASADFAGHPGLARPVVPSTAPDSPGFRPATYWRGPSWPVANWLLWWGLNQHGCTAAAATLREANLDLLSQPEADFAEYFHPFTGEPLGSRRQSWTAAAALDWLA